MLVDFSSDAIVADRTSESTSFFIDFVCLNALWFSIALFDIKDSLVLLVKGIGHVGPKLLVNIGWITC